MPQVKKIKKILENAYEQGHESTALGDFNHKYSDFIKLQA
jgi:hypothetical protein